MVRLADGSVRQYQRVTFDNGMRLVPNPSLETVPGISDAVAVSTSAHSLVLRSDGTVLAWGSNGHGQLGSDHAIDRRFGNALPQFSQLPVPVREIGNAIAVSAGSDHSVALLTDGTIRTWGWGEYGIPGDGVMQARMGYDHLAPTKVVGIESAAKISAGGTSVFALLKDGTIRAWGNNTLPLGAKGVLGTADNQTTAVPTPVQGISTAVDVVATGAGGAALLADGTLRGWGGGYGTGHRPQDQATNKPVTVEGIRGPIAISPSMVLLADGSVRDFPFQPSWATPKLTNAVAIASGGPNRFALLADGRLIAWGHKRWYPNGAVTLAMLGQETARQCAARPR